MALGDFAIFQQHHFLVAVVAQDAAIGGIDLIAPTFEHLQKDIAAVTQHAGQAGCRIVFSGLGQNVCHQLRTHAARGAACIQQTYQHDFFLKLFGFATETGIRAAERHRSGTSHASRC